MRGTVREVQNSKSDILETLVILMPEVFSAFHGAVSHLPKRTANKLCFLLSSLEFGEFQSAEKFQKRLGSAFSHGIALLFRLGFGCLLRKPRRRWKWPGGVWVARVCWCTRVVHICWCTCPLPTVGTKNIYTHLSITIETFKWQPSNKSESSFNIVWGTARRAFPRNLDLFFSCFSFFFAQALAIYRIENPQNQ